MPQIAWKWGSRKEAGYLDFVMHHFGIQRVYLLGDQEEWVPHRAELVPIPSLDVLVDAPLVVLAPPSGRYVQGEHSLHDFVHPVSDSTVYFIGANDGFLSPDAVPSGVPRVFIPTADDLEMHSHTALTCALWDRCVKHG